MKQNKQVHYDSGPNMTPLVDVVMVILIFLMLAGSFAGGTRYLLSKGFRRAAIDLPRASPDASLPPDISIRIDVGPSGFVAQSSSPRLGPTSSPEEMQSELKALRQKMVASGTPGEKLQIVLLPGRSVKYQDVLRVYQAALGADFSKVAMATSH